MLFLLVLTVVGFRKYHLNCSKLTGKRGVFVHAELGLVVAGCSVLPAGCSKLFSFFRWMVVCH